MDPGMLGMGSGFVRDASVLTSAELMVLHARIVPRLILSLYYTKKLL